ncbi:hypothetical protein EDC04DRAFT_147821 [Pisolithus marmoratus]|nr:hypothetical protein EDC04DRAFT_147821 [Pisolithus marmoratus]
MGALSAIPKVDHIETFVFKTRNKSLLADISVGLPDQVLQDMYVVVEMLIDDTIHTTGFDPRNSSLVFKFYSRPGPQTLILGEHVGKYAYKRGRPVPACYDYRGTSRPNATSSVGQKTFEVLAAINENHRREYVTQVCQRLRNRLWRGISPLRISLDQGYPPVVMTNLN